MESILVCDPEVLWSGDDFHPGVRATCDRLSLGNVKVVIFLAQDENIPDGLPEACDSLREPPAEIIQATAERGAGLVKDLLLAAQENNYDLSRSWLVTGRESLIAMAGQAGLQGVAWIGGEPLPTAPLGLIINSAQDLADAPRVMVPPGGGCWHQH